MRPVAPRLFAAFALCAAIGASSGSAPARADEGDDPREAIEALKREIAGLDEVIRTAPQKKKLREDQQDVLKELAAILPSSGEQQDERVQNHIATAAAVGKLRMKGVATSAFEAGDLSLTELRCRLEGTFSGFVRFLNLIENNESFLRVDEIDLAPLPVPPGVPQREWPGLSISVKISSFHGARPATAQGPAPGATGGAERPPAPPRPQWPIATLPPDAGEIRGEHDEAQRALEAKDYPRATRLFEKLVMAQPDVLQHRLDFAHCLFNVGKLNEARDVDERILSADPDDIEALLGLARVLGKLAGAERDAAKKADLLDQAKEALRRAARNGLNAVRAVETLAELAELARDPGFMLDLVREPQLVRVEPGPRDPFFNPLPTPPGAGAAEKAPAPPPEERSLTVVEQESLVKGIEAAFAELDALVAKNDFEGVGRKWSVIEEGLGNERKITAIDLAPKFKALMKQHREKLPVLKSLLLRAYYLEGERMIEAMTAASEKHDRAAVKERWEALQTLQKRMLATDERFAGAADDLLGKGRAVYEAARGGKQSGAERRQLEEERASLQTSRDAKAREALEIARLDRDIQEAERRIKAVLELAKSKIYWGAKLGLLVRLLPASTWLEALALDGRKLVLHCKARGTSLVRYTELRQRLRGDTNFMYHFGPMPLSNVEVVNPGPRFLESAVLSFTLTLPLRETESPASRK